jgi:hypothetical protein
MSFSRKKYDEQCYINQNKNDNSINNYLLNAPENDCDNCYQSNPEIRFQKKAVREDVSVENELFGIDRKDTCNNEHNGCNDGVCKTQAFDSVKEPENPNECTFNTVNSRFNSVKNLKELSANRWEWLPIDPQKHAIYDMSALSSRNHIKDNYEADYDTPIDATDDVKFSSNIQEKFTVPVKITPY